MQNTAKGLQPRNQPPGTAPAAFFPVKPVVQPKLEINAPGDSYEREADALADQMLSGRNSTVAGSPPRPNVQRQSQTSAPPGGMPVKADSSLNSYVQSLPGKGMPLPQNTQQFFGRRMGYDFGQVRVHTDEAAAESAGSIGAKAYTSGNNIVFNRNRFDPEGSEGQRLLAHEMAHVTQQNPTRIQPQTDIGMSVSHHVTDAPYGWDSNYSLEITDTEATITINVHINPDAGVGAADVARVQRQTALEFQRYWDHRFMLTGPDGNEIQLRVNLTFDTGAAADLTIALHAGDGRDDLSNWFVAGDSTTRAHELGHQLGLRDEYIDAAAPSRATAASPGVFTDNSIMGNYYDEGIPNADVRMRHGDQLATDISAATGMNFTAGWSDTYIVRRGDNLSWIARRIYGSESRWRDIYNLNRTIIRDPNLIFPGQELQLPPR
jgi:LysM repeat protein